MPIDLCSCHGQPLTWCPEFKDRRVITLAPGERIITQSEAGRYRPLLEELNKPEPGVVFQTYHPSECGICGGPIVIGEQVIRLPAPTWSKDMAHALCPP